MIEIPAWLFITICVFAVAELLWVALLIIDSILNAIDGRRWWHRNDKK